MGTSALGLRHTHTTVSKISCIVYHLLWLLLRAAIYQQYGTGTLASTMANVAVSAYAHVRVPYIKGTLALALIAGHNFVRFTSSSTAA